MPRKVTIPAPFSDTTLSTSFSPRSTSPSTPGSAVGRYVPVHRRGSPSGSSQSSSSTNSNPSSPCTYFDAATPPLPPTARVYSPAALLCLAHSPLVDARMHDALWRFHCAAAILPGLRPRYPLRSPRGRRRKSPVLSADADSEASVLEDDESVPVALTWRRNGRGMPPNSSQDLSPRSNALTL